MKNKRVCIRGTGSFTPEKVLSNADLMKIVDTTDEWITTRTGIKERRIVEGDVATSDMATSAARRALDSAGLGAEELELIIIGTATPDMPFPSAACLVQANLGAKNAAAFDVSAACSGFLYALSVAEALIQSGRYRNALIIGAETLTKIVDWEDRTSCILFGDGAGAAVLIPSEDEAGIQAINLHSDGNLSHLLHQPAGGSKMPASADTVAGRLHTIHMEGRDVFKYAVKYMARAMSETAEEAGLAIDQLDLLIPHQANLRIIEAVGKRLKISDDKVFVNVDRYGNTSAASVPIALDEAIRSGRVGPGSNVGLVVFGGGFTWASAVVKL